MDEQLKKFNVCQEHIKIGDKEFKIFNPRNLKKLGYQVENIPFSIIVLIEQLLRNLDGKKFLVRDIERIAKWSAASKFNDDIPFMPTRVVLQDFTGVPTLVDLASLRDALKKRNIDPSLINPSIPVDLIIDHSVQVDYFGSADSLLKNNQMDFERNSERYKFLKWGQNSFKNLRIFPPGAGIIHQINLEYLSPVSHVKDGIIFPDTLVGTDSHTTMINSLGVLGWGVGGIEAESAMLNQPIFMKIPEVVGFKLLGKLKKTITATDIVLKVTEMLRQKGVVEKFVEFYGQGLESISVADRATIANMAPEYGATMGYFPVDDHTLLYLKNTGRGTDVIERTKAYFKKLQIFRDQDTKNPDYSDSLELDLASVEASIAGPKRPQDRINLKDAKKSWHSGLTAPIKNRGYELATANLTANAKLSTGHTLKHGSIVIAAITSCTNTSNPSLLVCAGLLAKKAANLGILAKPWVKTSLAPGSQVVTDYLDLLGLSSELNKLGFYTVGYGCTTCIGNSGPLDKEIEQIIKQHNLVVCSVLSGNRNFEGRIHVDVKANYLASPPLVVAYAIAGTIDIDFLTEPIAEINGNKIMLSDIWPTNEEIANLTSQIKPELYINKYQTIFSTSKAWSALASTTSSIYDWDANSTYIHNPPFFDNLPETPLPLKNIEQARVLVKIGDSLTTDHISPAGGFSESSPAGKYLSNKGFKKPEFNTYGARRGNDEIMVRGTFANVRIRNQIAPETEGGMTKILPEGTITTIYEAAQIYKERGVPLIVLAGAEYGTGSSRDWAAKGPYLLGVKAVIAVSYERIHRSNLIGMGILPLQFMPGESAESLKLNGTESFTVKGLNAKMEPTTKLVVQADNKEFMVQSRLDTDIELEYYKNGGILQHVLLDIIKKAS